MIYIESVSDQEELTYFKAFHDKNPSDADKIKLNDYTCIQVSEKAWHCLKFKPIGHIISIAFFLQAVFNAPANRCTNYQISVPEAAEENMGFPIAWS